ncbi:MAG: FG-GAP-like repeat-containing protein [Planctomycetota bacterium]
MRYSKGVFVFLLLAGCGPAAIGLGLKELLKDETTPDLTNPTVSFLDLDGGNDPPSFTPKFEVPFRLEFSKVTQSLQVMARLFGPFTQAEIDALELESDADGIPLRTNFQPLEFVDDTDKPVLAGLVSEGVFRLVVVVEDGNGRRGWNAFTWTIDTKIPSRPELLDVEPVDPSSVVVSFADVSGVAKYIIEYEERASFGGPVTKRGNCEATESMLTEIDDNRVSFNCTGLRPGTIQRFRVRAEAGNELQSEWSATMGTRLGDGHAGTFSRAPDDLEWDLGATVNAVRTADFDEDGNIDIVAALEGDTEQIVLLLGTGDGRFDLQTTRTTVPFTVRNLRVAALADKTPFVVACGDSVDSFGAPVGRMAALEPELADEEASFVVAHLYSDRSKPVFDVATYPWSRSDAHDVVTVGGTTAAGRVEMLRSIQGAGFLDLDDRPGVESLTPGVGTGFGYGPTSDQNVWNVAWTAACGPKAATDLPDASRISNIALANLGGASGTGDLIVAGDRRVRFFSSEIPCVTGQATEPVFVSQLVAILNGGVTDDEILQRLAQLRPGLPRMPRFTQLAAEIDPGGSIASIAATDLDADGSDDLVVALENGAILVYDPAGPSPQLKEDQPPFVGGVLGECLLGDFAGIVDSKLGRTRPDILVCDSSSRKAILVIAQVENGALSFRPEAAKSDAGGAPDAVAAADFDGDGLVDIVVNDRDSTWLRVLLGNGGQTSRTGGFSYIGQVIATESGLARPTAGTNDDGSPLVVSGGTNIGTLGFITGVSGTPLDASGLIRSTGTASQQFVLLGKPKHVRIIDWNADGRQDFVLAGSGGVSIGFDKEQNEPLDFSDELIGPFVDGIDDLLPAENRQCDGLAVAEFDDDEFPDLVVACFSSDESVLDGHLAWIFGNGESPPDPARSWTAPYLDESAEPRTTVLLATGEFGEEDLPYLLVSDPSTNQLFFVLYDEREDVLTQDEDPVDEDGFDPRRLRKTRFDLSQLGEDWALGLPVAMGGRDLAFLDRSTADGDSSGRVHFLVLADDQLKVDTEIEEAGDVELLTELTDEEGNSLLLSNYVIVGWTPKIEYPIEDEEPVIGAEGLVDEQRLIYRRHVVDLDQAGIDAVAADLDDDGDLDLAVLLSNGEIAVIRQTAAGTFETDATRYRPDDDESPSLKLTGISAADMNDDGILDLVVSDAGDADGTGAGYRVLLGEERVDDLVAEEQTKE